MRDKNTATLTICTHTTPEGACVEWFCDFSEERGRSKVFRNPIDAVNLCADFFFTPVFQNMARRIFLQYGKRLVLEQRFEAVERKRKKE